jgi:hypothetical protein
MKKLADSFRIASFFVGRLVEFELLDRVALVVIKNDVVDHKDDRRRG